MGPVVSGNIVVTLLQAPTPAWVVFVTALGGGIVGAMSALILTFVQARREKRARNRAALAAARLIRDDYRDAQTLLHIALTSGSWWDSTERTPPLAETEDLRAIAAAQDQFSDWAAVSFARRRLMKLDNLHQEGRRFDRCEVAGAFKVLEEARKVLSEKDQDFKPHEGIELAKQIRVECKERGRRRTRQHRH